MGPRHSIELRRDHNGLFRTFLDAKLQRKSDMFRILMGSVRIKVKSLELDDQDVRQRFDQELLGAGRL